MQLILGQAFNGISEGSILLLVALGLAFTFGLMGVINMAHGEFIMIGAYVAYVLQRVAGPGHATLTLLAGLPVGVLVGGVFGWLLEFGLVRFLYGRPLDTLLATWGVSLFLQQAARTVFGAPNVEVKSPTWLQASWNPALGLSFSDARVFIIGLTGAVLLLLWGFLYHTASGRRMRAAMQNREMAGCLGVSTRALDGTTFALGSGLAALAGVVLTLIGPIGPSIGGDYIVDAFMVVVLGGVGQLAGAVSGAALFGTAKSVFAYATTASVGTVLAFAMIVGILQLRPSGLVARRTRLLD